MASRTSEMSSGTVAARGRKAAVDAGRVLLSLPAMAGVNAPHTDGRIARGATSIRSLAAPASRDTAQSRGRSRRRLIYGFLRVRDP